MAVEAGTSLAQYRIAEKLGEGGMGVVWRAVDTSLDREVAIKVLLPEVAAQPERLARFDREAKLLASLNHPNVASVYGFHEHEGTRFVVMELVEGEDLSQRIQRGPVPLEDALEIAAHIADALVAAHDRGVIHRDLKPANVRVTPDGTIKVLDFGLAKSLDAGGASGGGDPGASPTVTSGGTAFGMILGTAASMSPEQARGKPVDRRTDLWSFGCVLYEMLTGRPAFDGETVADTLHAVVGKDPDWGLLPAGTPTAVRRLLRRCLAKDVTRRVRDAADARLELLEPDEPAERTPAATGARKLSALPLVGAALVGAAVVGVAWMLGSRAPGPASYDRLPLLRQATFTGDLVEAAAVGGASTESVVGLDMSSDGRTVVYLTRERDRAILIDLDGGGSRTLYAATDGTTLYDAAWSPDGDRVYLMTWPYAEKVLSVPRLGGEARPEFDLGKLAGLNGIFVRPLPDDRWLVFGNHNTLFVGSDPGLLEAGGTQLHGDGVFRIDGLELLHRVAVSANGRFFAFDGTDASGTTRSGVADETGASRIVEAWSGLLPVSWSEGDRALYLWRPVGATVGDLLRVEVDPSTGSPTADPETVYPRLAARSLDVSADGDRLLVRSGDEVVNVRELTLDATPDAGDNPTRYLTRGTGSWKAHDILPDGTLLASLASDVRWELFSISPDGAQRSLVRPEGFPTAVAASRDGARIAITVDRPTAGILIHDRSTNRNRTIPVPEPLSQVDWSPDGEHLVGMTRNSADRAVVADVESGEARRVALDCGDRCEFAYEGISAGPEWPYFAVTSEVDVWVLDAETGALRHVADNTWNILDWQDGFIYFTRGPGQTEWPGHVLFRVPGDGGDEERLLNLPLNCGSARVGPGGRTAACNMDESRLDLWVADGLRGVPGS